MHNVYVGEGNAKQFVAGPFVDQATADLVAQAFAGQNVGAVVQVFKNSGPGAKQTSVSSFEKPSVIVTTAIAKGARTRDNET